MGNDHFEHQFTAIWTAFETCESPITALDGNWAERSRRA